VAFAIPVYATTELEELEVHGSVCQLLVGVVIVVVVVVAVAAASV